MKQILVFDDRISTVSWINRFLEGINKPGQTLVLIRHCKSVYEADTAWSELGDSIEIVVLDIMAPSKGLSDELRKKTQDDYITGWIWLCTKDVLNSKNTLPLILIYTAYRKEFQEYIANLDPDSLEANLYRKSIVIPKGAVSSAVELKNKILDALKIVR